MDSNVSKNTNSHNFFKLRVNRQKLAISVRDLLAKELILALALYRQKFNVKIEQNLLTAIVENKVTILEPKDSSQSADNRLGDLGTREYLSTIGYRCPVGLCLSTVLQQPPTIIAERLGQILAGKGKYSEEEFLSIAQVEILTSGWINFYLEAKFIADWLNSCLYLSQAETTSDRSLSLEQSKPLNPDKSALFPAQYLHARCCSLLSLAAREKLIVLATNDGEFAPRIKYPESIIWLDKKHHLWFAESAEYDLLRQLLRVTNAWIEDRRDCPWSKIALGLSEATAIFLADCRFLGEIKQKHPQKAIARLGLIALVQFWLQRILHDKLGIAAPKSM